MYILHYACQEFENFREAELLALSDISGVALDKTFLTGHDWSLPFFFHDFPSDEHLQRLVASSILIKDAYHVWCSANSKSELFLKIREIPKSISDPYLTSSNARPFRIVMEVVNKKLSQTEKIDFIEMVLEAHNTITAPISLDKSEVQLTVLLDFPYNNTLGHAESSPRQLIYGRHVTASMRRDCVNRYRLSQRRFIGNTSMDVRLSFLMASLARVHSGALVYDPFVGTGSILVACGHMGGCGFGMDIDFKLQHGQGKSPKSTEIWRRENENVRANFAQYELESQFLDCIVGDSSMHRLLRGTEWLDAIVTDPPYGVREASRKVAQVEREEVPPGTQHFPMKETYNLTDTFRDLVTMAAHLLRAGGRLTFWLPVVRAVYTGPDMIPQHPCLTVEHNLEQVLNTRTSRRLIVMRKTLNFDSTKHAVAATVKRDVTVPPSAAFREQYFAREGEGRGDRPNSASPNSVVEKKKRKSKNSNS